MTEQCDMKELPECDCLRTPENARSPDPRISSFVKLTSAGAQSMELSDYHDRMAQLILSEAVPGDIRVQFETTKNLYLYSWFVYRFFPIAEHQALVCLELALRHKYKGSISKKKARGLSALLRYAVQCGDVKNQGFERWHEAAERRARGRYEMQQMDKLRGENLDSIVMDYSQVKVTDEDRTYDHLKDLIEILPEARNRYAHGSTSLHNQVRGTIQSVAEIINQLYGISAGSESTKNPESQ